MGKAKAKHDSSRPTPQRVLAAVRKYEETGDASSLETSLTHRQVAFAREYAVDFHATDAAIRAGYSPRNAKQQAYSLTMNVGVRALIKHLTLSKQAKLVSINPDYVLEKVTTIVNNPETKDGDKLRALELLARHLGMFVDRTEITGKDGGPIATRQVEEEAQNFINTLKSLSKRANDDEKEATQNQKAKLKNVS